MRTRIFYTLTVKPKEAISTNLLNFINHTNTYMFIEVRQQVKYKKKRI